MSKRTREDAGAVIVTAEDAASGVQLPQLEMLPAVPCKGLVLLSADMPLPLEPAAKKPCLTGPSGAGHPKFSKMPMPINNEAPAPMVAAALAASAGNGKAPGLPLSTHEADAYEIGDKIQSGANGTVYKAKNRGTGEPVVVKVLNPLKYNAPNQRSNQRSKFMKTVAIYHQLNHPNIVKLLSYNCERGEMVFPYHEGAKDLMDHLIEGRAVRRCWFPQLTKAVRHMHEKGYLHRDIKPENILVIPPREGEDVNSEHVVLIDLDDACSVTASEATRSELVGTLAHLDKEVLHGNVATKGSDTYSLASTLYVTVKGQYARPSCTTVDEARAAAAVQARTPLSPVRNGNSTVGASTCLSRVFAGAGLFGQQRAFESADGPLKIMQEIWDENYNTPIKKAPPQSAKASTVQDIAIGDGGAECGARRGLPI